ncbi:hypothetical protein AHAS_Ahas15G0244100 [Arachis hypogaea]
MATSRWGRGRKGYEEPAPTGNQAKFLAVMTQLINIMQANVVAVNQVMERMNGNGIGNGAGGSSTAGPMTLATFLKVNPHTFRGSTDPLKAGNRFRAMVRSLQVQHVPDGRKSHLHKLPASISGRIK